MSEPFLGEIKMAGFNFAPRGYARCDGQVLPISQNQSLFSLLGTNFGGNGQTTFQLPDLRGRVPQHAGGGPGARGGEEAHALTIAEMPGHTHGVQATTNTANSTDATGDLYARTAGGRRPLTPYVAGNALVPMAPSGQTGNGQAHDNMQPYQVINFFIALQGLFPPRN